MFHADSVTISNHRRCENRTPSPTRGLLRDLDLLSSSVQIRNKGHKIGCAASYWEYSLCSWEPRIKFDVHRNHQAIGIRFSCRKTQILPRTALKNVIWSNIWIPSRVSCRLSFLHWKLKSQNSRPIYLWRMSMSLEWC